MKIKRQSLSSAITLCGKAVGGRTTLPILNCIFCEAENGTLVLRTTNLDVWVERRIECEGELAACCLSFDKLSKLVSLSSSDTVTLERKGQRAVLTAGNVISTLAITKSDEFPPLPKSGRLITVPVGLLADGIDAVAWLQNTENPEDITNAMKSNVVVQISSSSLDCIGFTGSVLAHYGIGLIPGFKDETILIPYKFAPFLPPVLMESNASVKVSENAIQVASDGGTVCVKLSEGRLGDWQSLIKNLNGKVSLFTIAPILLAAQRAQAIFGNDPFPRMTMELTGDTLIIESQFGDKTSERIPFKSEPGKISVNARFLANTLKRFDGETAECIIGKGGSKWRSMDLEVIVWHLAPEKEPDAEPETDTEAQEPAPESESEKQEALL